MPLLDTGVKIQLLRQIPCGPTWFWARNVVKKDNFNFLNTFFYNASTIYNVFFLHVSKNFNVYVSAGHYVHILMQICFCWCISADGGSSTLPKEEEHRQMDHLLFTSWQSPIFPTWAFSFQFCLDIRLLFTIFYKHINLSEDSTLIWGPPSLESIPLHIIGNK